MPDFVMGYLDADAFYVECERVRDAVLRNQAVGVLGNQGAAVIARSYELRDYGVKTGMPIWDAKKLCPEGIYLKRDFRWYEVLSRQLLDLLRQYSPRVEYYSVDEMFFEVPNCIGTDWQSWTEEIRQKALSTVGVPITVTIGRTRTLAKLAAEKAKPFGAWAVTDPDLERCLLEQSKVTDICGIASRRAARLEPLGIMTALDLAFADRRMIRKVLTITGEALWYELNGESVIPLLSERPPHKMLSRGGSIGKATKDPDRILAWLVRSLERLIEELEHYQVCPEELEVHLEHKNGPWLRQRVPLSAPTQRFDLLLQAAKQGLKRACIPDLPVHRLHIVATKLRWPGSVQQGLFEPPADRAERLARAKRMVNEKLGRFTVRSGMTLYLAELYRDPSWGYEICDIREKMCF